MGTDISSYPKPHTLHPEPFLESTSSTRVVQFTEEAI
jgi:hypothetical protein